jgi:hypothetical protein
MKKASGTYLHGLAEMRVRELHKPKLVLFDCTITGPRTTPTTPAPPPGKQGSELVAEVVSHQPPLWSVG